VIIRVGSVAGVAESDRNSGIQSGCIGKNKVLGALNIA